MKKQPGAVYVSDIKRRCKDRVCVTYLVRRVYREDGKVKQQTLGNLSHLRPGVIRCALG